MVDEGTDISNKSLMIYYFQFVENYKSSLKFLDILEIKDKTAKGLKLQRTNSHNLELKNLLDVTTDGANVMIGETNGRKTSSNP